MDPTYEDFALLTRLRLSAFHSQFDRELAEALRAIKEGPYTMPIKCQMICLMFDDFMDDTKAITDHFTRHIRQDSREARIERITDPEQPTLLVGNVRLSKEQIKALATTKDI